MGAFEQPQWQAGVGSSPACKNLKQKLIFKLFSCSRTTSTLGKIIITKPASCLPPFPPTETSESGGHSEITPLARLINNLQKDARF